MWLSVWQTDGHTLLKAWNSIWSSDKHCPDPDREGKNIFWCGVQQQTHLTNRARMEL